MVWRRFAACLFRSGCEHPDVSCLEQDLEVRGKTDLEVPGDEIRRFPPYTGCVAECV